MSFQTPITIKKAIDNIQSNRYLLPAIQREFVWRSEAIERLFDSLMRGYPIGWFLFWRVEPERLTEYNFYGFITDYDQRTNTHNPRHPSPSSLTELTAVLDGQQRLTALNIGLHGTYASKLKYHRWNNPRAFPKRRLHLNLLGSEAEDDDELSYKFRFLTDEQAERGDDAQHWYKVGDILKAADSTDIIDVVHDLGLTATRAPQKLLDRLYKVIHDKPLIAAWEEDDQDPERVLNIFVRTNSGGTPLSHSDMLLSMAVAQWDKVDARQEIHELVDTLNAVGEGFALDHDFVLKACLLLGDSPSVRFKVANFRNSTIGSLQTQWPRIKDTLVATVQLASALGYSRETLTASNALLPVAYFLHRDPHGGAKRDAIRGWLIRSLLKRGVWGSGLDTLLVAIRDAIRTSADLRGGFPARDVETAMQKRGKGLQFGEEEIEDLADTPFGAKAYSVLTLLYDFVDVENHRFHVDHVFPRALLTPARLRQAGVEEGDIDRFLERVNRLPNLQLLEGSDNSAKGAALPLDWLKRSRTPEQIQNHCERHDLGRLPHGIAQFPQFHDERRARIIARLRRRLAEQESAVHGPGT